MLGVAATVHGAQLWLYPELHGRRVSDNYMSYPSRYIAIAARGPIVTPVNNADIIRDEI